MKNLRQRSDYFFFKALLLLCFSLLAPLVFISSSHSQASQAQGQPPPRGYYAQPGYGPGYQPPLQASASQNPADNMMIILDGSFSMSEPLENGSGESKMMAAKRTILEVLRKIPPTTRVGFRVYGNSFNMPTQCLATTRLVPLGLDNRNLIAAKMSGIQPLGATPISYSLERSLEEDFPGVRGTRNILLISDGMETCWKDPCRVAVDMLQKGAQVKINVVGLGVLDLATLRQLKCVALSTKGQFYTARTKAELMDSLTHAFAVQTHVQANILLPQQSSGQQQRGMVPARNTAPQETELQASPPTQDRPVKKPVHETELSAPLPKDAKTR